MTRLPLRIRRANERALQKVLEDTGYVKLKAKHGKVRPVPFPDLSVPASRYPSLNTPGYVVVPPPGAPAGAKKFPVGNSHKQGLQLISPGSDPKDFNGAKK